MEMNNGALEGSKLNTTELNPLNVELTNFDKIYLQANFHYHKPTAKQVPCYNAINEVAQLKEDNIEEVSKFI